MPCVFRLHSTIEIRKERLDELLQTIDLPDRIDELSTKTIESTCHIVPNPVEDIDRYTPVAKLKGSQCDRRLYENEDGELVNREAATKNEKMTWGDIDAESVGRDDEIEQRSALVEFIHFKGHGDDVLFNSAVDVAMLRVLEEIALEADRGVVEAILEVDGELEPVYIEDGKRKPASVYIHEETAENEDAEVGWEDNQYISN